MSEDGKLYHKFNVTRTDGTHEPGKKRDGCSYFVLDVTHDPYAKDALRAYAKACRETHPELSNSINDRWLHEGPGWGEVEEGGDD